MLHYCYHINNKFISLCRIILKNKNISMIKNIKNINNINNINNNNKYYYSTNIFHFTRNKSYSPVSTFTSKKTISKLKRLKAKKKKRNFPKSKANKLSHVSQVKSNTWKIPNDFTNSSIMKELQELSNPKDQFALILKYIQKKDSQVEVFAFMRSSYGSYEVKREVLYYLYSIKDYSSIIEMTRIAKFTMWIRNQVLNDNIVKIFMMAYATIGQKRAIIYLKDKLIDKIPSTSIVFDITIISHCMKNDLVTAEMYLMRWFRYYYGSCKIRKRNELKQMVAYFSYKRILPQKKMIMNNVFNQKLKFPNRLISEENFYIQRLPIIETFKAMLILYSHRGAWIQAIHLINIIDGFYKTSPTFMKDMDYYLSDEYSYKSVTNDNYVMNAKKHLPELYGTVVSALCNGHQYNLALNIVKTMKERGYPIHPKDQGYLLSIFSSPVSTAIIGSVLESNKNMKQTREMIIQLTTQMSTTTDVESITKWKKGLPFWFEQMINNYVQRGYPKEADEFIRQIYEIESRSGQFIVLNPSTMTKVFVKTIEGYSRMEDNPDWSIALKFYNFYLYLRDNDSSGAILPLPEMGYHFLCKCLSDASRFEELAELMIQNSDPSRVGNSLYPLV